jgi:hypothetical protein
LCNAVKQKIEVNSPTRGGTTMGHAQKKKINLEVGHFELEPLYGVGAKFWPFQYNSC